MLEHDIYLSMIWIDMDDVADWISCVNIVYVGLNGVM